MKKFIILVFVLISVFLIGFYVKKGDNKVISQNLHEDLLPLYEGVEWGSPFLSTINLPIGTVSGVEALTIFSEATMTPSDYFMPFADYYEEKLTELGWEKDVLLEASGPGSNQSVYRKGDDLILVRYKTDFLVDKPDAPSECPCNVELSVFSKK